MEPIIIIGIAVPTAITLVVITVLTYLYYSGWFQTVEFQIATPPVRNLVIMYKSGTGAYEKAAKAWEMLAKIAPEEDTVILYYDDDNEVPSEKLRWAVGVIVAEGKEAIDEDLKGQLENAGYKRHNLPCANMAVQTELELKTSLSYRCVTKKVYPKLDEFIEKRELDVQPVVEIYEDDYLSIMVPLDNQDGFFVPEARRR